MDMRVYEYGSPDSSTVLLQMVDDHDLAVIENEVAAIRKAAGDFHLLAIKVKDWNRDLSPWNAPAVFGKEGFGGGVAFGLVSRFCGLHGRACDKMQAGLSESGGQGRKGAESGDGCCGREHPQGV